ncbi:tetratricopeptide repeat protein [Streptomyces sp. NPDC056528]|uniref:tetratricopeptide repeat protein n=1 Tax=Streptomyces sp. NPDC056528 TaxID=3345854 RepID=UPI00367408A2
MAKWFSRTARAEEPEPSVTVTDSGNAEACGDETTVSGYRGPAAEAGGGPSVSVRLSRTGDAIASGGGTAISGYVHNLTVQQRPFREPASWPHQVGVVPPLARSFQHRAETDRLRAVGGGTVVLTQLLTGMGGVGKTQLAADYARAAWEDGDGLDVLVWITASARSQIVAGYAQAGVELCRADPNDAEAAARAFLAWLAPKPGAKPCRWLIVLDDVDDPADLRGQWPPDSPYGRTLVTTRRRDAALAGDGRRTVEVGLFTPTEALVYLTTALGDSRTEPDDQLIALAQDLGHLPLALAQAAAYLVDTGDTVADYRELLADRTRTLADVAPDALPDDQALPLAAVWSLSVERADALRPVGLARPMLQLTSLLDPHGIPEGVLTGESALDYLTAGRSGKDRTADEEPTPVARRDAVHAVRVLHRLSLVDHDPATPHQAVRVHQLIQRATRDTLTTRQRDHCASTAADALLVAWPVVERDTELVQALRSNTTALIECAEDALYQPDAHTVLYRYGRSLGRTGQVTAARHYFQRLVDETSHRLGADSLDALTARGDLATVRGEAGDPAGAADAFADLLADRVRVLGEDHSETLAARNDLAHWTGEKGDEAGAADAFAALLADQIRVLGDEHSHTLTTRVNLVHWRGQVGEAVDAAAAFAELVEHTVRVLGPDHPITLTTRNNLAIWRGKAGDAAGAADAFARLLTDQERVIGPDHPTTLTTRNNLAVWRGRAGDAAGAAAAFTELLADQIRVLGDYHPDTLTTSANAVEWRREAGDRTGAADALADLATHMVRVLGTDHPDTLTTRGKAAAWRGEEGDAAGAAQAFADLLADRIRIMGADHPDTLITRNNHALWQAQAGDAVGAVNAFTELVADQERVLGLDHPHTLATRKNLATCQGRAGDAAGAAETYGQLLAARRRLLGEDHPETFAAWGSVAHWRGQSGDVAAAVTVNEQLLEHMERVLGGGHRHVQLIRRNLAHWRRCLPKES